MAAVDFPNSPSNGDTKSVGGLTYTYNSSKGYWDAAASGGAIDLSNINQNIVPDTDVTYDLGTTSKKFRDLYLSGSTLKLGTQEIKATASGIQLPELTIGSGTTSVKLGVDASGNVTQTSTVGGTPQAATQSVSLTDLSVSTASAGTAALAYDNTTGAFTYTPPDLSSYATTASLSSYATLASPTFTGTVAAPTPAASDNTTAIATTAYVQTELGSFSSTLAGLTDTTITTPAEGQVLQYDSATSKWLNVDSAGGGTTIELTANGAITSGKAVVLDSDGKVSAIQAPTSSFSAHGYKYTVGSGSTVITGNSSDTVSDGHTDMWYDDNIDRVIFLPGSASQKLGAGEINDSTGSITWTAILTLPNSSAGNAVSYRSQGFYNSTLNRNIILSYDYTADKIEGLQYTFSTSSATQNVSHVNLTGTDAVDWNSGDTFRKYPIEGTNKFILLYLGTSYTARLNIIEATTSGFTVGTAITPTTDNQRTYSSNTYYNGHSSGYSTHSGKGYYLFFRASDNTFVYDTFDVSGASPVLDGNIRTTSITSGTYINYSCRLEVEGRYAIITVVGQNDKAYVFTGEIDSSTGDITFAGTAKSSTHTGASNSVTRAVFVGPVGSGYFAVSSGGTTSGSTQPLYYMDGQIGTNGALTVGQDWYSQATTTGGSAITQNGGLGFFNAMGRTKETGKVIQMTASSQSIYGASSWATHHFVYTPNYVGASNFAQWIGIAQSTVANGENVRIDLPGGVNEQQSGMTIEGTYYVQASDGTIGSSATAEQAGVALSATKLLVSDNTANATANLSFASLASPTFTGSPAAPTAGSGTNTTQLATTEFVQTAVGSAGTGAPGMTNVTVSSSSAVSAKDAVLVESDGSVTKIGVAGTKSVGNAVTLSGTFASDNANAVSNNDGVNSAFITYYPAQSAYLIYGSNPQKLMKGVLNSDNDQMTVSMAATGETMDNPQSWAYDSANDVIWQGRHSNGVPAVYKITMGSSSISVGSAQTLGSTDGSLVHNQPLLLETSAGVMVHISVISASQLTANAFKEVGGTLTSSTPFSIDSSFQSYTTRNDGSLTYWARYDATTGYVVVIHGSNNDGIKATTFTVNPSTLAITAGATSQLFTSGTTFSNSHGSSYERAIGSGTEGYSMSEFNSSSKCLGFYYDGDYYNSTTSVLTVDSSGNVTSGPAFVYNNGRTAGSYSTSQHAYSWTDNQPSAPSANVLIGQSTVVLVDESSRYNSHYWSTGSSAAYSQSRMPQIRMQEFSFSGTTVTRTYIEIKAGTATPANSSTSKPGGGNQARGGSDIVVIPGTSKTIFLGGSQYYQTWSYSSLGNQGSTPGATSLYQRLYRWETSATADDVGSWKGLVQEAASAGGTTTIVYPRGLLVASGFTPNTTYFVQNNGTIGTSDTGTVAGHAVSSTHLLVADNSPLKTIRLSELKTLVSSSSDFADFKTKIAAL